MMSERFTDALAMAARLHRGQTRKGTTVPYVSHLLAVCSLVLEHGGDEEAAIVALLHDAVEDQGGAATLDLIRSAFGADVAGLVLACSDSTGEPKPPWQTRKQAYLAALPAKPAKARLVSCADKLHNARCLLADYRAIGEALWQRFTPGRDGVLWYYRALAEEFVRGGPPPLAAALADTVVQLENAARLRNSH